MKIKALTSFLILLALFPIFKQDVRSQTASTITLDPGTTYQTMTGWQAVGEIGQIWGKEISGDNNYYLDWRDEVVNLAVNDLGIDIVRIDIKSGDEITVDLFEQYLNDQISYQEWENYWKESINDNDDPFSINWPGFQLSQLDYQIAGLILPMRQAAQANGEKLYLVLSYHGGSTTSFNHANNAEEYAELIEAVFLHMDNTYGFVPDGVEVINEPNSGNGWGSSKVGQAIVATGNRLAGHGFAPDFFAPSNVSSSGALSYFDQLINTPGVLGYLDYISYHCYSGCALEANLIGIANRAIDYNKRSAMTEMVGHDYIDLMRDLKIARVSAWQQFALAFPAPDDNGDGKPDDDGAKYYVVDTITDPANPTVAVGSRTKYLRQFFKYVRRGAVRIGAVINGCTGEHTCSGTFDTVAFVKPDGDYAVVIKAKSAGEISILGLPTAVYGISYTTPSEYGAELPEASLQAGETLDLSMPDQGVMTVYTKAVIPTPTPCTGNKLGDANGDCKTDGLDYSVWWLNFGNATSNGASEGDFDTDGKVDGLDYSVWWLNFGT